MPLFFNTDSHNLVSLVIIIGYKKMIHYVLLLMTVKCPGASANMNLSLKASASSSSTSSLVHCAVGRFWMNTMMSCE